MTAPRDLDRQLDAFLRDGPVDLPDPSFDAVRDRIESTRQRVVIGPWRMPDMTKLLAIGLGAAAVVVAVVLGGRYLAPAPPGGVGAPSVTPGPSPAPLAIGTFESHGGDIELDASGDASNVTGTMRYTDVGGAALGGFLVDLKCTRSTDGGLIMIGGPIIESTNGYDESTPEGTNIAVILQRGSPVRAVFWIEHPDPHEPDCATFLASLSDQQSGLEPIVGTIELRP
jgi:hypothetical protein